MISEEQLRLIHLLATAFMTGLIWFVQVVHYPLFTSVGRDAFTSYEKRHTTLTTFVVAPAMLVEAVAAILILAHALAHPEAFDPFLPMLSVGLLAVIWFSTAFVQVPCHRRLSSGYDSEAARRLVRTNWARTVAWSARTAVAAVMVHAL